MNDDIRKLLERQAQWQRDRRQLSWPEKIRLVEQLQSSLKQWSQSGMRKDKGNPVEKKSGTK